MAKEDERKIIIDEDWKSQVEREREELRSQPDATSETAPPPSASSDEATPSDRSSPAMSDDPYADMELPPASLAMLISTLATQALAAMGQLPDPETGQPMVRPKYAKYQIDMLAMLQEKSKGNVTTDEAEMLEGALHELRMVYVQAIASQK